MKTIWVGDVIKDVFEDKKNRNLSATRIAEKLNISRTTLYKIISDPQMEPVYAVKLGKLLNIDVFHNIKDLKDYEGIAFGEPEEVYETKADSLREEIDLLKSKLIAVYEENIGLRKQVDDMKKQQNSGKRSEPIDN